jgi:hypothetical protein
MIPLAIRSQVQLVSMADVERLPEIATGAGIGIEIEPSEDSDVPRVTLAGHHIFRRVVAPRRPLAVRWHSEEPVAITWGTAGEKPALEFEGRYGWAYRATFVPVADAQVAVVVVANYDLIVNEKHPFARWIDAAHEAITRGTLDIEKAIVVFQHVVYATVQDFAPALDAWRDPSIPPELRLPPLIVLRPHVLGSPTPEQAG